MSYKKTMVGVMELVAQEFEIANRNYPLFHSDHEGESVTREELCEAIQEAKECEHRMDALTMSVFADNSVLAAGLSEDLEKSAVALACEAIQLGAMARKFRESQKARGERK